MSNNSCKKGFTLIELLVVVLIIGILAAIALPQYKMAVAKARTAQLFTRFNAIEKAANIYFLTNNEFPKDIRDLVLDIKEDAQYAHIDRFSGNSNIKGYVYPNGDQCGTIYASFANTYSINCIGKDIGIVKNYEQYPTLTMYFCMAMTAEGEKICSSLSPRKHIMHTYDWGYHRWDLSN